MKEDPAKTLKTRSLAQAQAIAVGTEKRCTNCGQELLHNFCSQCGQMKYRRIDKNYIIAELRNVFYATGGFFYSIQRLIRNPGKTAKGFIDGCRVQHYRPLYLAFVLSGFDSLIQFNLIGVNEISAAYYGEMHMNSSFMNDYLAIFSNYYAFIMLILIPVFASSTKLVFWKSDQNYYEHIVMNAYILSTYILLNIFLIYPFMYYFRDQPDLVVQISSISFILAPFLLVWFFKGFYPDKSLKSIIVRVFFILGILLLILLVVLLIFGIVYAMLSSPLEYIQPK